MSDYKSNFEMKLAYHTAPSLYGIKASSLMKIKKDEYNEYLKGRTYTELSLSGIKIRIVYEDKNSVLVLVYNENLLEKHINKYEVREYLNLYGYKCCKSVSECLEKLSSRIKNENNFPHEIGIFLGYPIEDVDGFIKNKGKKFKMCGFWKVYSDEEKTERTFRTYRNCRAYLCNKISNGADICEALGIL